MFVYKITNNINGKSYIGQTKRSPHIRWKEHKTRNNSVCPKLKRAFEKYGTENFSFEILCEVNTLEELNKKEVELISKYNTIDNGYNIDMGGKNKKRPKEVVEKILKAVKRKIVYQYDLKGNFIAKYKSITEAANKNNIHMTSIIHCMKERKMIAGNFQWKDFYSKKINPVKNKMVKPRPRRQVCKYSKNMKLLAVYKNAAEAARKNNFKGKAGIVKVCNGKQKTCGGFYWAYKE